MLPLQLWIHFSRSVEILHEEGHNKRESSRSFYVLLERGDVELSCGSLFLFKFDPVITFSQNGVITFSQDGIE